MPLGTQAPNGGKKFHKQRAPHYNKMMGEKSQIRNKTNETEHDNFMWEARRHTPK